MDLSEINTKKIQARWAKSHLSEQSYIDNLPNNTKYLKARIHGFLCGDGSVSWRKEKCQNKIHCEIRFYPDDISMVSAYLSAFKIIYNKKPTVTQRKNHFCVYLNSMTVVKDLRIDGSFGSTEWSIPDWVFYDSKNLREWLRAFYDSEAYINKKEIRIQSVNRDGIIQIRDALEKFGISSKFYSYQRKEKTWNTNYHLVISRKKSRCAFLKNIGFNHSIKATKLKADVA
jgi:intein/homing endonuclease